MEMAGSPGKLLARIDAYDLPFVLRRYDNEVFVAVTFGDLSEVNVVGLYAGFLEELQSPKP